LTEADYSAAVRRGRTHGRHPARRQVA